MNKVDESSSCCNHYFNDYSSIIPKTNRTAKQQGNYNINDMFYNYNNNEHHLNENLDDGRYISNTASLNTPNDFTKKVNEQQEHMGHIQDKQSKETSTITKAEQETDFVISQTISAEAINQLRISNELLAKDNSLLKKKCLLLERQLSSYTNPNPNPISQSPNTKYELELFDFISNLKQALNCTQMTNRELQRTNTETEAKADTLYKENKQIVQLFNALKVNYKSKEREVAELKAIITNKDIHLDKLLKQIEDCNKKIMDQDIKIEENESKIRHQSIISSSKLKYQSDTEETLNQLRRTIDSMQKGNTKQMEKTLALQNEIDLLKHNMALKEALIDKMQCVIDTKEKEDSKSKDEIEQLKGTIKQLQKSLTNKQDELRREYGESEKQKALIESLILFIEDRERTIATLKESLSILTKTFDNDLNAIKAESIDQTNIQKYIRDNSNELLIKIKLLEKSNEQLYSDNRALLSEAKSNRKDIDVLSEQYDKIDYEYQLLYQKFKEQTILIEKLKEEVLNKRKDNELIEVIKANEEILIKLNQLKQDNTSKAKELNRLKKTNTKLSSELTKTQRLLSLSSEQSINNHNSIRREEWIRKSNTILHNNSLHYNNNASSPYQIEINDLEESTSTQRLDSLLNNNTTAIRNYLFYTIVDGDYVVSFDLQLKQFSKLKYKDTSAIFLTSYDKGIAIKINIPNGLLVINKDKVFLFDSGFNIIQLFAQLNYEHRKAASICINNELYIVSGEKTNQCEKVLLNSASIVQLPLVNCIRTEGGLCYVDQQYLFVLFGNCHKGNESSIERLDTNDLKKGWEVIKYSSNDTLLYNNGLSHFICISQEQRIMLMGGITHKGVSNHSLILYDYHNGVITSNGDNKCYSLFNEPSTLIEDNVYINFDIEGNPHIFDALLSFYKVYKLNYNND